MHLTKIEFFCFFLSNYSFGQVLNNIASPYMFDIKKKTFFSYFFIV